MDKLLIEEKLFSFFIDRKLSIIGELEYFKKEIKDNNLDLHNKLDIERKFYLSQNQESKKRDKLIQSYQDNVNTILYNKVYKSLEKFDFLENEYLNIHTLDLNLINSLFFSGISLTDIKPILQKAQIRTDVFNLFNNIDFKRAIHREENFKNIQMAINHIGLENIRLIIPILFFRRYFLTQSNLFNLFYKKLWTQQVIYSTIVFFMAKKHNVENPYQLYLMSLFRYLGVVFIFNSYIYIYKHIVDNKLKAIFLEKNIEDIRKELSPCVISLKNLFIDHNIELFGKILKQTDYFNDYSDLIDNLNEESNVRFEIERYILKKAEAYSTFYTLSKNKIITNIEGSLLLKNNDLTNDDLDLIKKIDINLIKPLFI